MFVQYSMARWKYGRAAFFAAIQRTTNGTKTGGESNEVARELLLGLHWMVQRFDVMHRYLAALAEDLCCAHFRVCHAALDDSPVLDGHKKNEEEGLAEEECQGTMSIRDRCWYWWRKRAHVKQMGSRLASKGKERNAAIRKALLAVYASDLRTTKRYLSFFFLIYL